MTRKFHVGELTKGDDNMVLVRDLFAALGLDLKFSDRAIVGIKGPYEGFLKPMVDVITYNYAPLTDKIIKPE